MSSSTRTSSKGGQKSTGGKTKTDKGHNKTDKTETGHNSGDKQHVAKDNNKLDENLKDKVQTLIETTHKSEEEVCAALQENNNDIERAANFLIELTESDWSVKKKKSRQPSSKQEKTTPEESPGGGAGDEWNEIQTNTELKDKPLRSKSGGPNHRQRGGEGRGWRGREKQENERNLDPDGGFGKERRGRLGGGGVGGRGGGRGGRGGRGRFPRGGNRNNSYNKPIETWDNNNSNTWDNSTVAKAAQEENWDEFPGTDEWSTEEYTGSLADTKVFTPSVSTPKPGENHHEGALDAASHHLGQTLQINQQVPPVAMVGTLNAAQTKYLNQLTQQNSEKYGTMKTFQTQAFDKASPQYVQGFNNGTQPYQAPNTYAANSSYGTTYGGVTSDGGTAQQPLRTKTRARVPPPSKIPSNPVEMPGDITIGYLDVQFGAMDFMSDGGTFDDSAKYNATSAETTQQTVGNLDLSSSNSTNQNANIDAYSPKTNAQSSISSALTQNLPNVENIPTSEHGTGSYSARTSTSNTASSAPQAVMDINKQTDANSYNQSSTYPAYQSKNSYNSSFNTNQTTASSYQSSNSYVNSQTGSYNNPASGNAYQNSYSSATYQSSGNATSGFPSITGANQSSYQNASHSVYGANTGLNSSSTYNTSSNQYNNYSSATNKLKESVYDGTNVSGSQATTSSITSASTTLSLSQSTTSSASKTTASLGGVKNSSNVVSNMPPGVAAPVMSTPYNMVQLPYFQQPLYSYEDMQLLQQRLPHMTAPFYDMTYQTTPTTLAAVRDAATLAGNVGYSISSDGRFTRSDNNASPVPSTLGQGQTGSQGGHQAQPIIAGAAAPPYFFATHFNTIPTNYPFYQLPAATNAHGTNNSSQYPKPGGYSSGYGAYDALSQTQDYGKGTYVGNAQTQKGSGGTSSSTGSSGNDLTAMYGKSHTALGKVNSYEKQGFHSGTPPPFTGTLHGNQSAGLAPSGAGYAPPVYISTMGPHQQHHSTQMMHQPLHQIDVRHQGRRMDSGNNSGQRSQTSNQAKTSGKQYTGSYWNQS